MRAARELHRQQSANCRECYTVEDNSASSRLLLASVYRCPVVLVVLDSVLYSRLDESSAITNGHTDYTSFVVCSLSRRRCSMKQPFVVCSTYLLIITLIGELSIFFLTLPLEHVHFTTNVSLVARGRQNFPSVSRAEPGEGYGAKFPQTR